MNSIRKNYIYNLIYEIFAIITPMVTTPYISRVLGASGIGEYSYGLSIATYFGIFGNLGLLVYGRLIIAKNRDNNKRLKKIIAELYIARSGTLLIMILLYLGLIYITPNHTEMLSVLIIYLLAQLNDVSWIMQGLEEFRRLALRNIIIKFASVLLIFLFIKNSSDIYTYALIMQGTTFIGNFFIWPYIWKYIKPKELKNLNSRDVIKHIRNSFSYFIPTIATTVYTVLDKSMIGWITNSNVQNGYYEQAHRIEQILVVVLTSLSTVTLPRIAYLNNKKDKMNIKRIIRKTILVVLLFSIPMCIGLIGISNNLVSVFLGDEFVNCTEIVNIFSFLIIIVGLNNIIGKQCLIAVDKQREYNISVIAGSIINALLNIVAIRYLGALGAAISSVCSEVVILIICIYYSKENLNVNIKNSLFKYIVSAIFMYIAIVLTNSIFDSKLINMLIQIFIGIVVYFICLILFHEEFTFEILRGIKQRFKES